MENENNNSNLNSTNNIQPQFNNSNGYGDVNFQNSDPYASQINSNLSNFNDNTISYNDSQISTVDNIIACQVWTLMINMVACQV